MPVVFSPAQIVPPPFASGACQTCTRTTALSCCLYLSVLCLYSSPALLAAGGPSSCALAVGENCTVQHTVPRTPESTVDRHPALFTFVLPFTVPLATLHSSSACRNEGLIIDRWVNQLPEAKRGVTTVTVEIWLTGRQDKMLPPSQPRICNQEWVVGS